MPIDDHDNNDRDFDGVLYILVGGPQSRTKKSGHDQSQVDKQRIGRHRNPIFLQFGLSFCQNQGKR